MSVSSDIRKFKEIQEYMVLAKKENATETYNKMKEKYLVLKVLLDKAGVNVGEMDEIRA